MIMRKLPLVPLVLLLTACATTEPQKGEFDLAYEKEQQAKRDRLRMQRLVPKAIGEVLLDLNTLLWDYFEARKAPGNARVESHIVVVRKALRQTVAVNFARIVIAAEDPEYGSNRAVALAALGFAERREQRAQALTPLLNGLNSPEQKLVSNACLGLGELKDSRTPPTILADLLLDTTKDKTTRLNACWALTQLHEGYSGAESKQLLAVWLRILRKPDQEKLVDPEILTPVVRGLGLFRNPDHARVVEPFTTHPIPSVRRNAAIALGRMGNQKSHTVLLRMLGPAEKNANVRLAARKALQALAGNIDGGYDVQKWKRLFARTK
ncbi:MAG: HEAT repeat domain-containing protein [Planctomycetota bacterium]|jgi:hypothetical protein